MEDARLRARAVAGAILAWHRGTGIERAAALPPDVAERYLQILRTLEALDPIDAASLQAIASAQLRQEFEWSYGERLPAPLWDEHVGGRFPELAPPANLGEAGGCCSASLRPVDFSALAPRCSRCPGRGRTPR